MKAMFMSSVRTRASVLARAGLVLALVAVGLMGVGAPEASGTPDGLAELLP